MEVAQPCARCDTVTTHRPDPKGILRCVRCVLEESLPPNDTPTPVASPITPMPAEEPKKRRPAEIIAAIVTVLVLAFLVYAFIRRP